MKIAKNVLIILLLSLSTSCSIHINDYYSGIVVDEFGLPIEGVSVTVIENLDEYSQKSITDENGFFKMNRSEVGLPKIIISRVGFISDTIPIMWSQHGEIMEYSTLIKTDSTKLVLRRKKN